jgi:hypothetical protein
LPIGFNSGFNCIKKRQPTIFIQDIVNKLLSNKHHDTFNYIIDWLESIADCRFQWARTEGFGLGCKLGWRTLAASVGSQWTEVHIVCGWGRPRKHVSLLHVVRVLAWTVDVLQAHLLLGMSALPLKLPTSFASVLSCKGNRQSTVKVQWCMVPIACQSLVVGLGIGSRSSLIEDHISDLTQGNGSDIVPLRLC